MNANRVNANPANAGGAARTALAGALLALAIGSVAPVAQAADDAREVIDLGASVPSEAQVHDRLFPEDIDCPDKAELAKAGFKCMGAELPPARFSLPAVAFRLGSADVPEMLRRQLDVFARVLSPLRGTSRRVIVYGHTDATGGNTVNGPLSQQRADAVKRYLVQQGVEPVMVQAVGVGAKEPRNAANPAAPENRRVEIGR